jgi:restriction system protein
VHIDWATLTTVAVIAAAAALTVVLLVAFALVGLSARSRRRVGGPDDGGVDLLLHRDDSPAHLVQCKHYRVQSVGPAAVRELYGVMAARGATGGFVVTSGRFTNDAISFASGRNVTLVDGPKLLGLIRQSRTGAGQPTARPDAAKATRPAADSGQPSVCPLCTKPMVHRTAKRGANAGGEFWGCTGYPTCRGTRPIG